MDADQSFDNGKRPYYAMPYIATNLAFHPLKRANDSIGHAKEDFRITVAICKYSQCVTQSATEADYPTNL